MVKTFWRSQFWRMKTPCYEGGKLWLEMIERLNSEGFTLWAIQKGFTDPRDGRTLQVDAIFFRLDEK